MTIEKNLRLINLFALFSVAWAFVPILLPYCQDRLGIGYKYVIMSEAVFAASCVLFDVPTGWISDVWKRKYTLALGAALNCLGTVVLLFATNFWHLFLSQAIIGIGISLFNGTHTALLYDSLAELGREDEYRKREGKRQALGLYGYAATGTAAGFLYHIHPTLPVWLTIFCFAVTFVIVCFLVEPTRRIEQSNRSPLRDIVKSLRRVVVGMDEIGVVVLFAAIIFSATKTISWTQQPYYQALNLPIYMYGILMSAGWMLSGMASHAAHLLDGRVDNFRVLIVCWLLIAWLCFGAAAALGYHGIVFLMIGGSCIYGTLSPRVNEIINRYADASNRATLLSTQTFMTSLLFIPISSLIGIVTDEVGIRIAVALVAVWVMALGGGLYLWKKSALPALTGTNRHPR